MHRIAVIGDRDSVLGFKALGFETVFAGNAEEGRSALRRLEDCAIIYITEKLASEMKEDIARYADRASPAIVPIPGKTGSLGTGMDALVKAVERAVGANILN
jgi:V/A-type H+-transporting ATPase subunit F